MALAGLAMTGAVRAGGDLVAFPDNYAKGVLYTTVDRPDNKQYRELFSTPEAIEALKAGKTVNDKAVLKNCFTCHLPLDKQDFVFSFDKMKGAK
jgi:hypothetical protein